MIVPEDVWGIIEDYFNPNAYLHDKLLEHIRICPKPIVFDWHRVDDCYLLVKFMRQCFRRDGCPSHIYFHDVVCVETLSMAYVEFLAMDILYSIDKRAIFNINGKLYDITPAHCIALDWTPKKLSSICMQDYDY